MNTNPETDLDLEKLFLPRGRRNLPTIPTATPNLPATKESAEAIVIGAKAVGRGRRVEMAVLEAVVVVREDPGRGVVRKVLGRAGRGGMVRGRVVRGRVVDFGMIGAIRAIRANVAKCRSRCRKSMLPLFRTKRVSSPWRGRSR